MEKRKKEIFMKTIEFDLRYLRYYIYLNNNKHNKNFPSFVNSNGYRSWCFNNKWHNPYKWAFKNSNEEICYYLNGVCYIK